MLRAIFGTDNALKTTNPAVATVAFPDWWTLSGIPGAALGTNIARIAIDQDGWISGMSNGVDQIVPIFLRGLVPNNPNKLTIGYRIKTLAVYGNSHSITHLTAESTPNDVGTYLFLAGPSGAPWLTGVGTEYYVEHTYDFVTGVTSTLVNGVAQANYTGPAMPAGSKAAFVAGTGCLNFRLGTSVGGRYAIRDIYILDDIAGDGMTAPLGSQRMYPVQLDVATGAGWVAAGGGTVLDTLNAPYPATNSVTSAADKTPLDTSLKHSIPAGSRIAAVKLGLTGKSLGDAPSTSKVEVTQGGTTLAAKFVVSSNTAQSNEQASLLPKAPDGTTWTLAKLDATAVKLTPDTSV
ncbi:hypothetical protein D3C85_249510 [compost metagenome]